jgi:hypothetical protein
VIDEEAADDRQCCLHVLDIPVESINIDTENFESSVPESLGQRIDSGNRRDARRTPGCPEVDEDNLSLEPAERNRLAVNVGAGNGGSWLTHELNPAHPGYEVLLDSRRNGLRIARTSTQLASIAVPAVTEQALEVGLSHSHHRVRVGLISAATAFN